MTISILSDIYTNVDASSGIVYSLYLSSKIDRPSQTVTRAAIFGQSIFGQSIFGYDVIYGSNQISSSIDTSIGVTSGISSAITLSSPLQEI